MAVGNVVGSNILDVLLPVGLAAVINPVHFEQALLWIDLPLLSLLTIMALAFFLVKRRLRKGQALCLVAFYAGYMLFKVLQAG
jgi:cation:H+ antiporter